MAEARGDPTLALRRLAEAEAVWRRRLGGPVVDDAFRATIADLGRVPVGGMVEPAVELGRVLAERARVLAASGERDAAADAATRGRGAGRRRPLRRLPCAARPDPVVRVPEV